MQPKLFYILEKISSNRISSVFLCQYTCADTNSSTFIVIKVYNGFNNYIRSFERKAKMMQISYKLKGLCNIIGRLNQFDIIIDKANNQLYNHNGYGIIMEYVYGQTLEDFIYYGKYNAVDVLKIADRLFGIISGFHQQGFIHRDIKPENIMINDDLNMKIIDFQFSTKAEKSNEVCGTYIYMAPEILKKEEYTMACDVYSFGLLLFKLVEKENIFNLIYPDETKLNDINTMILINGYEDKLDEYCRSDLWKACPELKTVLEKCLKVNPNERLKSVYI